MTVEAAYIQPPLDPAGRIAQDVHCIHCGYNLRTLSPDQVCPECGKPVQSSLRSELLRFSDPAWLARLRSGMKTILIGSIVGWVAMQVLGWSMPGLAALGFLPATSHSLSLLLFFGIPTIGVWRATSLPPGFAGTARDSRLRPAARLLLLAFVLLLVTSSLWSSAGTAARPVTMSGLVWMRLSGCMVWVMSFAGWAAFWIHMSRLARRMDSAYLARLSLCAAVALVLLGLTVIGTCAWACVHMQTWLATSQRAGTFRVLTRVELLTFASQQLVIFALAVLYHRQLRREALLAADPLQDPPALARAPVGRSRHGN